MIVLGLGHVGSKLPVAFTMRAPSCRVSDVDPGKRDFAEQLGARWLEPHQAHERRSRRVRTLRARRRPRSPTIAKLRVSVVAGAANNQLATDSAADALRKRGIVWAPDFVANAGGLIAVSDELHGFDEQRVERAIERIGKTLEEIYARAAAAGTNTLIAAQELAAERSGGLDDDDH